MTNIPFEKPPRTEGGSHDRFEETHPAYILVGASRVSSTPGAVLFGSDFRHQHYITITIAKATYNRGLSNDWYFGNKQLIQIALSEAQWATFVSSLNVGQGVPATLEWLDGCVPRIAPIEARQATFHDEVDEKLDDAIKSIDEVLATATLKKADRAKLEHARRQLGGNLDFVVNQ